MVAIVKQVILPVRWRRCNGQPLPEKPAHPATSGLLDPGRGTDLVVATNTKKPAVYEATETPLNPEVPCLGGKGSP